MEFRNDKIRLICGDILKSLSEIDSELVDMVIAETQEDSFKSFTLISQELKRIVGKGGIIVWITSDRVIKGSKTGNSYRQALHFKKLDLNIHDVVICDSGIGHKDKGRYSQCFSYVFILSKGAPKTFNQINTTTNIIKQDKLIENLILNWTNRNETILEIKMINGNAGVRVVNNDRHFIGITNNQNNYDISKQNILREIESSKMRTVS